MNLPVWWTPAFAVAVAVGRGGPGKPQFRTYAPGADSPPTDPGSGWFMSHRRVGYATMQIVPPSNPFGPDGGFPGASPRRDPGANPPTGSPFGGSPFGGPGSGGQRSGGQSSGGQSSGGQSFGGQGFGGQSYGGPGAGGQSFGGQNLAGQNNLGGQNLGGPGPRPQGTPFGTPSPSTPAAGSGSGLPAESLEPVGPPTGILIAAAVISLLGIVVGVVLWGDQYSIAGWFLSGPVAIAVLSLFASRDTARRAAPVYLRPGWLSSAYAVVIVLIVVGVILGSVSVATWIGHL